ncbi:MAG: InlB B-repeat-containing protein, partial [Oscillospiraceae bacterium]|nr:InlB B-repeat-containing protein [Oscillospiraceae bacterium]
MKCKLVHRVLTLALILAMAVLWLPTVSHAAGGNTSSEAELRSKLSDSESGDIILNANIGDIVTPLIIERSLTLDLNGHMLSINLSAAVGNIGNAIKINKDVTLTIKDSDINGILTVINKASSAETGNGAAINTSDGTLIVQGGMISAIGGANGAGIGGGSGGSGGTITISGGSVYATGGSNGAGIGGGGGGGAGGVITISGGSVTAIGGANGAGIGGGNIGAGGAITISGGVVKAEGRNFHAAGIGGGQLGVGGTILISGGTVTATGASGDTGHSGGAGIGGTDTTISIIEGTVTATGCNAGAGIGGSGVRAGGTISITGGTVVATGSSYNNAKISGAGIGGGGIGGGGTIFIGGGMVTAIGGGFGNAAAMGRGTDGEMGTVRITGTYKYWLNTTNTEPKEPVGEGTFTDIDPFRDTAGYKYVILESQGTTPPQILYSVTFVDWDDTILKQQEVISGGSAVAPPDPVRSGYNFKGWDKGFSNVTSNMTVTALYEIIIKDPPTLSSGSSTRKSSTSATVEFTSSAEGKYYYKVINHTEEALSAEEIKTDNDEYVMVQGTNTIIISSMKSNGACKFCIVGEDSEGLISDVLVVYMGEYVEGYPLPTSYSITFVDWDDTILKQQEVISGESAEAPPDPVRNGYNFIDWDKDFSNVTSDLVVTALYEIIINDPPTLSSGSSTRKSSTGAAVDFTSSADGKYYYKVIGSIEAAPSVENIKTNSGGNVMAQGKNTVSISNLLGNDACKICIVGEDSEGLISNVLTVAISKFETDTGGLPSGPPDPPTPTPTEAPEEPENGDDDPIPGTYSDWAREELNRALAMGLIPSSLLNPNIDLRRPISRVEFAGVTVKAYENLANTTVLPTVSNPFTDTQDVDALKAFNAGIMIGISLTE